MEALKKAEQAKEQASKISSSEEHVILRENDKEELAKSEKMLDDLSLLHESAIHLQKAQNEQNEKAEDNTPVEPSLCLEPIENAEPDSENKAEQRAESEHQVETPTTINKIEQALTIEPVTKSSNDNNTFRSESAKLVLEIESENKLRENQEQKSPNGLNNRLVDSPPVREYNHDKAKRIFSISSKQKKRQPLIYLVCGIFLFSTIVGVAYYYYLGSPMGLQQDPTQFVEQSQQLDTKPVANSLLLDQQLVSGGDNDGQTKPKKKTQDQDSSTAEISTLAAGKMPAQKKSTIVKKPVLTRPKISSNPKSPAVKVAAIKPKKATRPNSIPGHETNLITENIPKKVPVKDVSIVRQAIADPILSQVKKAYDYYQKRNFARAVEIYQSVLNEEPENRDARLGLAAIAMQTDDLAQAHRHYRYLLRINPKDSIALSGVMSAITGANALKSESQIKLLLDQEPRAAHLHFTLGNLLAAQSRWSDAQQSYFQAYRFDLDNADYAYNLAVSLDFMGKQKSALSYYRKALSLSKNRNVSFNGEIILKRINSLSNPRSTK